MRNGSLGLFFLIVTAAVSAAVPDPAIPVGYPIDRYLGLRNPFVFPSLPVPEVKSSIFDKLTLESWSSTGSEITLYVRNNETGLLERVTALPNANSLRLIALNSNPDIRQVTAILSDGSRSGAVKFKTGLGNEDVPPPAGNFNGGHRFGGEADYVPPPAGTFKDGRKVKRPKRSP